MGPRARRLTGPAPRTAEDRAAWDTRRGQEAGEMPRRRWPRRSSLPGACYCRARARTPVARLIPPCMYACVSLGLSCSLLAPCPCRICEQLKQEIQRILKSAKDAQSMYGGSRWPGTQELLALLGRSRPSTSTGPGQAGGGPGQVSSSSSSSSSVGHVTAAR